MDNGKNNNSEQSNLNIADIDSNKLSQEVIDAIMAGASFKDLLGLSDDFMKQIFEHACFFYNSSKLEDAEKFFKFLCIYDSHNSDYITGYAAVCQLQGNYQKASALYSIAFTLNPDNFHLLIYLGQCLIMSGDENKAKECFNLIMENCNDSEIISATEAYLRLLNDSYNNHSKEVV